VATERHLTPVTARARRALWIALGLNAALLVAELVGGLGFSSLALLADAAHQASDVVALSVALLAQALVLRPGSARHTYGLLRAEALGAQINAVVLIGAAAWVFVEAANRLDSPQAVDGTGLVALGAVALLVNLLCAALLVRVRAHDLNMRAAWLHMASDAGGSFGALVAGVAVLAFGADIADPIASILIGVLVVAGGVSLLRDTTNVLLEAAPRGLDVNAVEAALIAAPHVEAVHHLHVWELGSELPALSVHVVLDGEPTLHDAQSRGTSLKLMLAERFGIEHATLELECHDCGTMEGADHRSA
jgi:cobalt-zinc-cadmium efflux system protein